MDKPFAIFDMDGTLVDSMSFWQNLAEEYLHSKGVTSIPPDLRERIRPMTMSESAALFCREFGLTGDPEAEMNAIMDAHYLRDIPLKPGVEGYLQKLRRRGVRMCVASASAEPLMERCLDRLGILEQFEFLLSCETVAAGKQRPDVYLEAARRLGAEPGQCAVYEDALYAVKTAKDAGFYVVGVREPGQNWAQIQSLADETLTDCNE